ncbi:MAG: hypothetical protein IH958_01820 [Chloroflexi bacterium]|nr:hypothetical protein [Chloroflexota bacterium]
MARIAYLGPQGTFTEEAALKYSPAADPVPLTSEAAVATAVESGEASEGILPIENSLQGSVTSTIDALIHDTQLAIRGELILPIELCLIVRPGTKIEDITAIYSKERVEPADVEDALSIMEDLGSRIYCEKLASDHWRKALNVLQSIPLASGAGADLKNLGEYLLVRES